MQTFSAKIVETDRGGAYVQVPAEVVTELGGKGRIPVRATFDGIAYDGSVVSMGGEKIIGVLKNIRTSLGKQPGDTITVTLEPDDRTRTVTVPKDLAAALKQAKRDRDFARLSYSHQREYVTWIDEAKKPETRARRIAQTVVRLA